MGIFARLGRMVPRASAQGVADNFLSGVGGGVIGGGLGAALGGDDSMVPGALSGAAFGAGAHAIVPLLIKGARKLFGPMSEQDLAKIISQMNDEEIAQIAKHGYDDPRPVRRAFGPGGDFGPREPNPLDTMTNNQLAREKMRRGDY